LLLGRRPRELGGDAADIHAVGGVLLEVDAIDEADDGPAES